MAPVIATGFVAAQLEKVRVLADKRYLVFQIWDFAGDLYDLTFFLVEEDVSTLNERPLTTTLSAQLQRRSILNPSLPVSGSMASRLPDPATPQTPDRTDADWQPMFCRGLEKTDKPRSQAP
jgi:hypothetical protein